MRYRRALLCTALCLVHAGCTHLSSLRDAYRSTITSPVARPSGEHLALVMATGLTNQLLGANLRQRAISRTIGVPGLPELRLILKQLIVEPSSTHACNDELVVTLSAEIWAGHRLWSQAQVRGLVPVVVTTHAPDLHVIVKTSQARGVRVSFSRDWQREVANAVLRRARVGALRRLLRPQIRHLSELLKRRLMRELVHLLRRLPVERFTRVQFRMPQLGRWGVLPIHGAIVSSCPGGLVARVTTTLLATRRALPIPKMLGQTSALLISGETLVQAIHLAIGRGLVPGRFNTKGQPDPRGPLRVTFAWGTRAGTLGLRVWHLANPAGVMILRGHLSIALKAGKVAVALDRFMLVSVRGSALFRIGVWTRRHPWIGALKIVKSISLPRRIRIGSATLEPRIGAVRLVQDGLLVYAGGQIVP